MPVFKRVLNDLVLPMNNAAKMKFINGHFPELDPKWDLGAFNIWEDDGIEYVDIEWSDGFTAFNLEKVMKLIDKNGKITKEDLTEYCH